MQQSPDQQQWSTFASPSKGCSRRRCERTGGVQQVFPGACPAYRIQGERKDLDDKTLSTLAADVTDRCRFDYMAAHDAKITALNTLYSDRIRYQDSAVPLVMFSDPHVPGVESFAVAARTPGVPRQGVSLGDCSASTGAGYPTT